VWWIEYLSAGAYTVGMSILNIRNLAPEVHKALRMRAASKGRSMEAEARQILTDAIMTAKPVATAGDLQAIVERLYAGGKPRSAVDDLIRERRREARRE